MTIHEMTDEEIRTRLKFWLNCQKESRHMVKRFSDELLRRKKDGIQDGSWSAWGYTPYDD